MPSISSRPHTYLSINSDPSATEISAAEVMGMLNLDFAWPSNREALIAFDSAWRGAKGVHVAALAANLFVLEEALSPEAERNDRCSVIRVDSGKQVEWRGVERTLLIQEFTRPLRLDTEIRVLKRMPTRGGELGHLAMCATDCKAIFGEHPSRFAASGVLDHQI